MDEIDCNNQSRSLRFLNNNNIITRIFFKYYHLNKVICYNYTLRYNIWTR